MKWVVLLDGAFEIWLSKQKLALRDDILAHAQLLSVVGPQLGRPRVDTVHSSRHAHMKELRVQWKGDPWRGLLSIPSAGLYCCLVVIRKATGAGMIKTYR